jgi:hypothetical protein
MAAAEPSSLPAGPAKKSVLRRKNEKTLSNNGSMPEKKGNINRRNNNYEHDAHVPTVHERQDQCYDNIFQRVSYLELYSRHSYRVHQNAHHLQNCSWLVIMYVVVVSFLLWLFRSSLLDNGLHNNGNGEGFGFWSSVAVSRSRKRGLLPLWSVLVGHSDG